MKRFKIPKNAELEQLVEIYKIRQHDFWKNFVGLKTITDFVCGKDTSKKSKNGKYLKNWHQRRLTDAAIENISGALNNIPDQQFDDFEQLIGFVRRKSIKYFKHTNSYDFAFRYGINHGIMPEKYVFIHSGARIGALALLEKGYITFDIRESRIPIESFPAEIRVLPAYHIENFLCVMKKNLSGIPVKSNS